MDANAAENLSDITGRARSPSAPSLLPHGGFGEAAPHAAATPGRIAFEGAVNSPLLGGERTVHIYLPGSYDFQRAKRYPVLYLNDGQNAFSTAGPGAAFGWGPWDLDNTVSRMVQAGEMREIILVAVDCSASRYREYLGPTNTVSSGRSAYSLYSRFLIEELKPKIDREYRTLKGPGQTGIMGSSMGGLCSVALAWEHPEVFGLAAALSTSFQVEQQAFLRRFLKTTKQRKPDFKLYLDSGRVDYSGGTMAWPCPSRPPPNCIDSAGRRGRIFRGMRNLRQRGAAGPLCFVARQVRRGADQPA